MAAYSYKQIMKAILGSHFKLEVGSNKNSHLATLAVKKKKTAAGHRIPDLRKHTLRRSFIGQTLEIKHAENLQEQGDKKKQDTKGTQPGEPEGLC
jgi:hypothetical protein